MKLDNTLIDILMKGLRTTTVKVDFIKKDGEARTMECTLNPSLIPEEQAPKGGGVTVDEIAPSYVRVFDVEKQGWRSIIFDNITNFQAAA